MKICVRGLFFFFLSSVLAQAELKVASLSTITTDIAKNVGGNKIVLSPLVKPGTDPHDYQPTPGDVKTVSEADLVLITGRNLEGYLTKLEKATGGKARFIDTSKALTPLKMEEAGQEIEDPHWWHSINNVAKATEVVRDAFISSDPANAAEYKKNAESYLTSLKNLEKWAKKKAAELGRDKRKLVTSHDAFQYFARDFGFKIYAVEGVDSDHEPSSKNVAQLIELIKTQQVKAVFAENIQNPKVLTEITRETGAKLGGKLYADGLGDKEARTYEEMMRHNLSTVVDALK